MGNLHHSARPSKLLSSESLFIYVSSIRLQHGQWETCITGPGPRSCYQVSLCLYMSHQLDFNMVNGKPASLGQALEAVIK